MSGHRHPDFGIVAAGVGLVASSVARYALPHMKGWGLVLALIIGLVVGITVSHYVTRNR